MGMKWQLKVIKADGGIEQYFHTKVLGTINNALVEVGMPDIRLAEELAEAVTYFLYNRQKKHSISSSEILSIIKTVLAATNNEPAAIALDEHQFERRLKRNRIEVFSEKINELLDDEMMTAKKTSVTNRWDKSIIVNDLVNQCDITRQTARTVASMVEEKILAMKINLVSTALIKQLVLNDAAAMMHASRQLQGI
jgi:hypothetical protein